MNILHWNCLVGLLSHHTVVGYPLRKVMVVSATWVTAHSQVTLDNERNNCRSVQRMIGDFVQFLPHDFVLQARFVKTVKVRNWLSQHLWSAGSDRRFSYAKRCEERSLSTGSRIGHLKHTWGWLNVQSGLRKFL